jgi:frataxin-like iron-binding protein CyaY
MIKSNFNQFMQETQKEIEKLQEKQKTEAKKIILATNNMLLDQSPVDKGLYKHSHTITVNSTSPEISGNISKDKDFKGDIDKKVSENKSVVMNLDFKNNDKIIIQNRVSYANAIENGSSKQHPPFLYSRASKYAKTLISKAKIS